MSIICVIAGHKAGARTIWNQGTHFGKCARCTVDLVEQQGRWNVPPPWFRVVWKAREEPLVEAPLELTTVLAPKVLAIAPPDEERAGTDRRLSGADVRPASLRVDRRRGERRRSAKRQAIIRV